MKTKLYTHKRTDPFSLTLASGLIVAILVLPITSYAAPKERDDKQYGRAYGHLVAPGFQKNFGVPAVEYDWLPPGIATKVANQLDYIDPDLDTISIDLISTSSATVTLESSEPVTAELYASTETGFSPQDTELTDTSTELDTGHTLTLTGLTPATTYYYLISLTDKAGNTTLTEEMSFETSATIDEDTEAPIISDLTTEHTDSSITVAWSTDEDTNSTLLLSTMNPIDPNDVDTISLSSDEFTDEHSVTATELMASTTYYGVIKVEDEVGNKTTTDTFTVTTDEEPDVVGPILTNIFVAASSTTANISWNTNEDATSIIYYDTMNDFNLDASTTAEISEETLKNDHSLTLTGLEPETTYYFAVASVDESDNYSLSSIASFTTSPLPDTIAPVISETAIVSSTTTLTASWMTNEPATSALYTATTSGFALDDDGVMSTNDNTLTTNHELEIVGLLPATTYYHRIVSTDAAGNTTISDEITFGTQ